MRSLPLRVTDTPVPCSCARSLASWLVHVGANAGTRERTDARADQRAFAAFLGIVAGGGAEDGTRERADAGALGGVVDLLLAGIGVGGLQPATVKAAAMTNNVLRTRIDVFMQFSFVGQT